MYLVYWRYELEIKFGGESEAPGCVVQVLKAYRLSIGTRLENVAMDICLFLSLSEAQHCGLM